jgi:hypothetical protein
MAAAPASRVETRPPDGRVELDQASGNVARYRLNRGGSRQLNLGLDRIAITRLRMGGPSSGARRLIPTARATQDPGTVQTFRWTGQLMTARPAASVRWRRPPTRPVLPERRPGEHVQIAAVAVHDTEIG